MSHQLVIDPGGANETTFTAGRITSLSFARNPSALSDWRASLGGIDFSLEDLASDEIHIKDGSEFLYRGFLHTVSNTEADESASINLEGAGIEYDLTRNQTTKTFSNVTVHDAIETVWGETSFTANVTPPTANQTVTGQQAQEASTTAEFNDAFDFPTSVPLTATGDAVVLQQTSFTEGRTVTNRSAENGGTLFTSDNDATYGQSFGLDSAAGPDWVEYEFTLGHDIPAGDDNFLLWCRERAAGATDQPTLRYTLDGATLDTDSSFATSYGWEQHAPKNVGGVNAGTHTIRIECTSSGTDTYRLGTIAPMDGRFDHQASGSPAPFDNTLDGNQGHLDDPTLYPAAATLAANAVGEPWSINEGTLTTTWDDTSGGQAIQLRVTGGTWFPNDGTQNNTTSVTTSFGTEEGSEIQGRATWSRYGSRTGETPKTGFNGQSLQSWEITYDGDDVPVIDNQTFEGSYFDILKRLHDRGRMHFWVDHAENSKNAFSAPEDGVTRSLGDVTVRSRTQTTDLTDYFNHVTVRGVRSGGSRLSATEPESTPTTEINDWGKQHLDVIDPTLETQDAVDIEARTLLAEKLTNRETTGEVSIVAENVSAGPSYDDVDFGNGVTTAMLQEIDYQIQAGELRAMLRFRLSPVDLGEQLAGLNKGIGTTRRGF